MHAFGIELDHSGGERKKKSRCKEQNGKEESKEETTSEEEIKALRNGRKEE